jgi:dTDP-4-dehydrorhamnose reductase
MVLKILLFGNKGQVGREIEELAAINSFNVYGFDIDNLDITDLDQIAACVAKYSDATNVVINAAAYTAVDKAEDDPVQACAVNCYAVKHLAQECRKYRLPFLHISTDYVFSGEKNTPYTEEDITSPLGVYGKSKLAGEEVLAQTWEKHIILRVSWIFGKYGNNFVKTILRLAQEREELRIVGDQYGCPTAAADVARVLLEMAKQIVGGKTSWGIYNYCGAPATTWYEFAKKIIELGSKKNVFKLKQLQKITTAEYPTKALRPKNSELAVNKIIIDYNIMRYNWVNYLTDVINFL